MTSRGLISRIRTEGEESSVDLGFDTRKEELYDNEEQHEEEERKSDESLGFEKCILHRNHTPKLEKVITLENIDDGH